MSWADFGELILILAILVMMHLRDRPPGPKDKL